MKFILIYMTAAMVHGSANLGQVPPDAPIFQNAAQCGKVLSLLTHGKPVDHQRPGWQCIPQLESESE
jgi:hypothetical protein